jgi:hypothetical protein
MSELTNQEKLEEVYHMTVENNKILQTINRRDQIATAMTVFYWVIIIGALGGVYYYIKPAINLVLQNKARAQELFNSLDSIRNLPQVNTLENALNNLQNKNIKDTTK